MKDSGKKVCDMCGKEFIGKSYKVVDENFNVQKGLISCGCDMDVPDNCCQVCGTPLREPGICSPCVHLKMKLV